MMWMKTKKFQKNMKKFLEGVKTEIETIHGGKKIEYGKIKKKLGLNLMVICH